MQHVPTIQVFAFDIKTRNNKHNEAQTQYGTSTRWSLPYVRVGVNGISDSSVSDVCQYEQLQLPVSEFNGICRIAMSISDFGNPDYIGFCCYRRFFTASTTQCILQVEQLEVDACIALSPAQQLCIMMHSKAAGIVPFPFLEHYMQDPKSRSFNAKPADLAEYWLLQLQDDNAGFTLEDVRFALDSLVKHAPTQLKPFMSAAMQMKAVHFCMLFTMRTDLFMQVFSAVFNAMNELMMHIGHSRLLNMNSRCGGYIAERFFSVMIWALKLSGQKLVNIPIAVTDCNANPSYRRLTSADRNFACNTAALQEMYNAAKQQEMT